jgi:hypothetical protein
MPEFGDRVGGFGPDWAAIGSQNVSSAPAKVNARKVGEPQYWRIAHHRTDAVSLLLGEAWSNRRKSSLGVGHEVGNVIAEFSQYSWHRLVEVLDEHG